VVVRKGIVDVISDGKFAAHCGVTGSPRRVGGQGDVLCGVMGVFNHWAAKSPCPGVLAASAACALTRIASRKAYAVNKRSMLTSDILNCVGDAVEEMASSFPSS
jgi:ATP-dependent NAD(P)H-hydrate dehydratase